MFNSENILFEDNHIIIINKVSGQLVQPDKEKNDSLEEDIKAYIKKRDSKPGNVFLGVIHRIDRPVSGVVLFAKTSKALARLNQMQQERKIKKVYWAITANSPQKTEGTLEHYIVRNESKNISIVKTKEAKNAKLAVLNYSILAKSDLYYLWQIELLTGRHHQIRCQLSYIQCPIRGDVKYGFPRANPDKSISLHARMLSFLHPVTNNPIAVIAPVPNEKLWNYFEMTIK
ncbi:MAG TPA: RNA pseudouridine synthase [Bacteroidales bacterium]|jgi:23S rRNA pseudouridine1911/1915/1917 synthase|nr:RNA pseudouridine synthase [Bacteroidales bacterium]HNV95282.1 RNA pseudouridine synthase [Bacteroidales bacterium]